MLINDPVYGREEINEPVLVDLIISADFKRLEKLHQFGIPPKYFCHIKYSFTRQAHSLGVMILLKRLGANSEEQVAGLLHDISTTAFSHVIDTFVGDAVSENFQDKRHLKFMESSSVLPILKYYGLDYKRIVNLDNFPILEQKAPKLCADRVDYTLQEIVAERNFVSDIDSLETSLRVVRNEIIFNNINSAEIFAKKLFKI